jgi:(2R)-3-sulfolactate dehydrogenase (NADP+)
VPTFTLQQLTHLAQRALARAGASDDTARATAHALVAAEAQGLTGHGMSRVPQYALHLRNGRADGNAVPAIVRSKGAAFLVDAGSGLAFPACALAVTEAVHRARESGVAFAGVTNSQSPAPGGRRGNGRRGVRQFAGGNVGRGRKAALVRHQSRCGRLCAA